LRRSRHAAAPATAPLPPPPRPAPRAPPQPPARAPARGPRGPGRTYHALERATDTLAALADLDGPAPRGAGPDQASTTARPPASEGRASPAGSAGAAPGLAPLKMPKSRSYAGSGSESDAPREIRTSEQTEDFMINVYKLKMCPRRQGGDIGGRGLRSRQGGAAGRGARAPRAWRCGAPGQSCVDRTAQRLRTPPVARGPARGACRAPATL
jgi:hypothetical protein